MSIISKAKSAISKVASKVKSVVSGVYGAIKTAKSNFSNQLASVAALPSASKTATQGLNVSGGQMTAVPKTGTGAFSNITSNQYTPIPGVAPAPKTVSAGSSPLRLSSNTSSASYDTSNFGLSEADLSYYSQPRNISISTGSLGTGSALTGTSSGTSGTIGSQMVMPSAPVAPNYAGDIMAGNIAAGASPETGLFVPSTEPLAQDQPKQKTAQDMFQEFLDAQEGNERKYERDIEAARKNALEQSGVEEARKKVNETQSKINGITAQMNADILSLRTTAAKEGVKEAVYGGQQAQITYEANVKLLPLQAQLAADQGNLEIAEEKLNELYSIYFKQVEARANHRENVVKATWDFFTNEEKKKIDATNKRLGFEEDLIKKEIDGLQSDATQALKDKNMPLYRALSALRPPTNVSSPTYEKDKENFLKDKQAIMSRYGATIGSVGGEVSTTVQNYADLLAQGKISLSNVPQNIRNAVVAYAGSNISKPLSDTAVKEIQQSESAIANLKALKTTVEGNLQFVGPISGLARFNPWSKAKQVQAEIDRVRQQVGKTLEGGVLRKEDEEKYKKILATLADTPETAIYKIEALIGSIERDIATYKSLQEETGRYVPGGTAADANSLRAKYNY